MNKLRFLFLLAVSVFSLLALSACVTTTRGSYGEIVYRIDFSHPDETGMTEKSIARTLRLSETRALLFYDSASEECSFRHIRLNKALEAEGQYLVRDGFDASFPNDYGAAEVELSVFPTARCMFVAYQWRDYEPEKIERPADRAIAGCNRDIVRRLEQGGFKVNNVSLWNRDESIMEAEYNRLGGYMYFDKNRTREYCINFEDAGHNVPSEMELKSMLDREFFFTTVLNIDSKSWGYRFFCMLDRFRNVLFFYHVKDKKLRVIDQYQDNTENYKKVENILRENGYTIKNITESTFTPTFSDTEWVPDRQGEGNPYHYYSVPFITRRFFFRVYKDAYKEISPLDRPPSSP